MSLRIDADRVVRVMVGNQWFEVARNTKGISTFYIDAYEFVAGDDNRHPMFGGGQDHLVPAAGFGFKTTTGTHLFGPLTALQLVEEEGR